MCLANFDGNKVQECTVGDLQPGQRYRDPDGNEFLVVSTPAFNHLVAHTPAVNLATGGVDSKDNSIRLGRDRAGRLYASRYLNDGGQAIAKT